MTKNADNSDLVELTAEIVSSYVANNNVPVSEVGAFIREVFQSLSAQVSGDTQQDAPRQEPAVPVKKSVTPEFIICLEDGKKFKSLKRHLRTHYDLSPEEYRAKWGLPADYPMVAPRYAEARSELAKQMGLGRRGKKS
tara:strand:+ start:65 stop:478 length:414 start_codon:yes stop_codon:yes gene_type:complete